jgi:hypothetical protein
MLPSAWSIFHRESAVSFYGQGPDGPYVAGLDRRKAWIAGSGRMMMTDLLSCFI